MGRVLQSCSFAPMAGYCLLAAAASASSSSVAGCMEAKREQRGGVCCAGAAHSNSNQQRCIPSSQCSPALSHQRLYQEVKLVAVAAVGILEVLVPVPLCSTTHGTAVSIGGAPHNRTPSTAAGEARGPASCSTWAGGAGPRRRRPLKPLLAAGHHSLGVLGHLQPRGAAQW